ncbi:MAG: 1-deoxy-D-xylulose-5-phosphate synthase [Clostridium sp.]|uniref:1-deoxy-D-xylulose-5-phosphate synthase n=1 Tax=Clostridium sp. TaxID=1506 RepID=UPI002FC65DF6
MSLLDNIKYPKDIKNLTTDELYRLADEIRNFLICSVSKTGGHLAPNLGVVELTIALHKVFNMPEDKIVWDVGHQSYVHKILTGRKERFDTLRKYNGLSGFPRPNESEYDSFSTGHSSTSISAAFGMAKARDIMCRNNSVVAVIGDGALTGGVALEALNHAGNTNTNMIVVLNDNEMSIAPNVGSLSSYLARIRTQPTYMNLRDDIEYMVKKIPAVGNNLYKAAERVKESVKSLLVKGMLFEELGFTYLGPIDGHNIKEISNVLTRAKKIRGPVLVHVITKKGKGYYYAENKPDKFHGIGPFSIETGEASKGKANYSSVFGDAIVNAASENENIVAITAAMPDGTGLSDFASKYSDRFFDVGIAEQHAVTFAAGLASQGLKPVFAVYSTFLQRAYDQVLHDVCIQNLPVMFCIDRAGIVGEDGETHQGVFDISYLRDIPNLVIMAPKSISEFKSMLKFGFKYNDSPIAIRYPRGGDIFEGFKEDNLIEVGKWEKILEGSEVAIVATGKMVQHGYLAAKKLEEYGIKPTLINGKFIKPLDENMIEYIYKSHNIVFTIEDNVISGGFGEAIVKCVSDKDIYKKTITLGYPDEFIHHGSVNELYEDYGLNTEGIVSTILQSIEGEHHGRS